MNRPTVNEHVTWMFMFFLKENLLITINNWNKPNLQIIVKTRKQSPPIRMKSDCVNSCYLWQMNMLLLEFNKSQIWLLSIRVEILMYLKRKWMRHREIFLPTKKTEKWKKEGQQRRLYEHDYLFNRDIWGMKGMGKKTFTCKIIISFIGNN